MSTPLLEINNLSINFLIGGKRVNAVHDVSFSLEPGETLGIVGESGCGKSVTATSILRLLPPRTSEIDPSSSIKLEGRELTALPEREFRQIRGKEISMIFQEPMTSLNPVQTVGCQMMEMVRAHQRLSRKDAEDICTAMLRKVGIPAADQRMKEYPHQLSGGMRQRVMIAMALSCNSKVLIADEPTTALDVTIQAQILELMQRLKSELGTSIILITHDMGVVAECTDKVMVMYAGEAVEFGKVEDIFLRPAHPYTIGLQRSIPKLRGTIERLATIDGTVPALTDMPSGCRFADRCPRCTQRCRDEHPQLLDIGEGRKVRCLFSAPEKGGDDHVG